MRKAELLLCLLLLAIHACSSEKALPVESIEAESAVENFLTAYGNYTSIPATNKLLETAAERQAMRKKAYEQKKLALQKAKEYGDQMPDTHQISFQEVYDSIKNEIFTEDVKAYLEKSERMLTPRKNAIRELGTAKLKLEKFYPEISEMDWIATYNYIMTKKQGHIQE